MRRKFLLGVLMLCSCGCSTMSNTGAGAATGGIIGGTLGTLAGLAVGRPLAGAAIGAGAGAGLGAIAGNAEDRAEARENAAVQQAVAQQQQVAAQQQQVVIGPVGLQEIAKMAQDHISDAIIINYIRNSGTTYNLRGVDIDYLKQQGVSDPVVIEMQSHPHPSVPPGGVTVVQPVYPRPVYVAPVGVGFGYGYGYRRGWY